MIKFHWCNLEVDPNLYVYDEESEMYFHPKLNDWFELDSKHFYHSVELKEYIIAKEQ